MTATPYFRRTSVFDLHGSSFDLAAESDLAPFTRNYAHISAG